MQTVSIPMFDVTEGFIAKPANDLEAPEGGGLPDITDRWSERGNRVGGGSGDRLEAAHKLVRSGGSLLIFGLLPIGAWMALAPLSMAVVAPAFVKVDLNRRPVQHLEGGIVREVLVRDGQQVMRGEPILVLGDVGVEADRNRLRYRVSVERATLARLEAEQQLADRVLFSEDLEAEAEDDVRVRQALQKELSLFDARRKSLSSELALLKTQSGRIEQEIGALRSQISQGHTALGLQRKELEASRSLLNKGFIPVTKVTQLEAGVVDYASKLDQQRAEMARAEQRQGDNNLRLKSLTNEYVQRASDQLRETAAQLRELEQELLKSEDAATRQVIVAPATGEVIELKVNSPGTVVRPGESVAEILPKDVDLMIEAKVRPEDINSVHMEQAARIKFTSFKYRSLSMASGKVTYVSADRLIDDDGKYPYYRVVVEAHPGALQEAGDIKLLAGMPAEVYLEGTEQTPLQYLLEPVTATLRHAAQQL